MKNLIKTIAVTILLAVTFTSCEKSEVITNNYSIEYVNVTLDATELVAVVDKPMTKASTRSTTAEYQHKFPESYTAYFVSKESKGEFTKGQIVDSIQVKSGDNNIRIPKLSYDVYVTNYKHQSKDWIKWKDAVQQLPQTSDKLYLLGSNSIDYSKVKAGQVELVNPYAAVMIKDNRWVSGTPKAYDTGQDYFKASGWYILYLRNNKVNTQVPIEVAGNPNKHITLNQSIEANNIYQFILDGSVELLENGNLGVIVKDFTKTVEETIKL